MVHAATVLHPAGHKGGSYNFSCVPGASISQNVDTQININEYIHPLLTAELEREMALPTS